MSVTFSTDLQQFIASQVASGAFRDQNELLAEAVRALRMRQEKAEKRVALLTTSSRESNHSIEAWASRRPQSRFSLNSLLAVGR